MLRVSRPGTGKEPPVILQRVVRRNFRMPHLIRDRAENVVKDFHLSRISRPGTREDPPGILRLAVLRIIRTSYVG
jgi:hypothetical protein